MPYVEFKSVVKKVNLKPGGKKEILLEINDNELNGKLDSLSAMIDSKVEVSLDSLVINYNITLNAHTDKPLKEYKVDDKGVVQEIKPVGEQLEADLDLPPAEVPTKQERAQVERTVIDDFILSGFAPKFDDLDLDVPAIVKRKLEGETYLKIASELNLSSGKLVEMIDEYYIRVAPLANKWDEWRAAREPMKPTDEQGKEEDRPSEDVQLEQEDEREDGAA